MSAVPKLAPTKQKLYVELARSEADVREAQQLRYRIFAEELGAELHSEEAGLDADRFDPHCEHLLVRETGSERIVGCTRLLTDDKAELAGNFYSAGEFDLAPILALSGKRLEVGRTCIDPAYRSGAAIAVLWSGLAGYIQLHDIDYLFGCASIELDDGGVRAEAIMQRLRRHAMASTALHVRPLLPLPDSDHPLDDSVTAPMPPLLKAYVRLGARACGEPCWDPDFKVADVLMLLDVDELNPAYSRHFLERAQSPAGAR
jgi:putative hemolysin